MYMFLLSRAINRGNLRSAGVSRFFARPLRYTGFHHLRRGHHLFSFYIELITRVLPLRVIPQELLARRVAWLLTCRYMARCCIILRGGDFVLVYIALVTWPAPKVRGSALSQNSNFSELRFRFRATLFTSPYSLFSFLPFGFWLFTTGRLTIPYPERLILLFLYRLLFDWQPLPSYPLFIIHCF